MTYRIPSRLGWVVVPPENGAPLATYLMHLPDGDPHALYETGALIWALAAEGESDVAGALAELLEVPVAEVAEHVADFVAHLVADGLLEVAS